jgi:hypothetical protein
VRAQERDHLGPVTNLAGQRFLATGAVLDDGSAVCGRWVGRHYSELPGPVKVIRGVDPLAMFGEARAEAQPMLPRSRLTCRLLLLEQWAAELRREQER